MLGLRFVPEAGKPLDRSLAFPGNFYFDGEGLGDGEGDVTGDAFGDGEGEGDGEGVGDGDCLGRIGAAVGWSSGAEAVGSGGAAGVASNLKAQDRILTLASDRHLIVPGHDPTVFERFPAVADGIVRIK